MNSSDDHEWSASVGADPSAILNEAVDDTRSGCLPRALAKFTWFFANSKDPASGLGGVRLSFALSYWHDLAKMYPPAMAALEDVRNRAAGDVISSDNAFESFHEFSAINRTLRDDAATLKMFEHLDARNPNLARDVYMIAEPVLLRHKRYEVCNRYLEPNSTIDHAAELLEISRNGPYPGLKSDDHRSSIESSFRQTAGTVVAILVIAGRKREAMEIVDRIYSAWDDPSVRDTVEHALKGVLPQSDGA